MLNLPDEFKKELKEIEELKKPLKSKKEVIKNITDLRNDFNEDFKLTDIKKQKFIEEIKSKNIIEEIKTLKNEKKGFFNKLKIILGF